MSAARRTAALTVALAMAAAACADSGSGGLDVERVTADVPFGEAEAAVPGPANFNPGPVTREQAVGPLDLPGPGGDPGFPSSPIAAECPEAVVDEFPDLTAPRWQADDEKALPREGRSRWRRSGTLRLEEAGGAEIEVDGFERRSVRNVEIEEEEFDDDGRRVATTFTYEVVQPDVSAGVVVSHYRVRTDAGSVVVPSPVSEDEMTAGAPGRGLALQGVDVLDDDGNRVGGFSLAGAGLLLLPVEIRPGEEFRSSALDPARGQQLSIEGRVLRREQVDACGDMVEGWLVESTLSSTGGGASFSRSYDYVVAPQYGATLIWERIEQGDEGENSELHLEFSLAQQDPDPLPPDDDPEEAPAAGSGA